MADEGAMVSEQSITIVTRHDPGLCLVNVWRHDPPPGPGHPVEHMCGLKAPHTGDHECSCGYAWPGETVSGPSNP